jgi:hypothetical protein
MNSTMALTTHTVRKPSIPLTELRLFKRVENNISRTDDLIPSQVALPIGSYTVVARSQRGGEVRVHFVIKAGQWTIVQAIRNFSILPRLA